MPSMSPRLLSAWAICFRGALSTSSEPSRSTHARSIWAELADRRQRERYRQARSILRFERTSGTSTRGTTNCSQAALRERKLVLGSPHLWRTASIRGKVAGDSDDLLGGLTTRRSRRLRATQSVAAQRSSSCRRDSGYRVRLNGQVAEALRRAAHWRQAVTCSIAQEFK